MIYCLMSCYCSCLQLHWVTPRPLSVLGSRSVRRFAFQAAQSVVYGKRRRRRRRCRRAKVHVSGRERSSEVELLNPSAGLDILFSQNQQQECWSWREGVSLFLTSDIS